jgi:hypothetical protein
MKRLLGKISSTLKASLAQLDLFSPAVLPKPAKPLQTKVSEPSLGLEILYAPRLHKGWRMEWRPLGPGRLTLPRYMEDSSFAGVREKIFAWTVLAKKRKTAAHLAERKALEKEIWQETEALLRSSGKGKVDTATRIPPIRTQGAVHDLAPHFSWVNERMFAGQLKCHLTWSGRVGGLSYHSKRKDPRTGAEVDLISISRGYDHENCPDYALRGIIYHECLHIAVPPEKRTSRRVVHGREFRSREKLFPHYQEWKRWHEQVLARNVRALLRAKKPTR